MHYNYFLNSTGRCYRLQVSNLPFRHPPLKLAWYWVEELATRNVLFRSGHVANRNSIIRKLPSANSYTTTHYYSCRNSFMKSVCVYTTSVQVRMQNSVRSTDLSGRKLQVFLFTCLTEWSRIFTPRPPEVIWKDVLLPTIYQLCKMFSRNSPLMVRELQKQLSI